MGAFKQVWDVYKESGCELTLHRSVAALAGGGGADDGAVAAFVAEMEAYLRDPDMFLLMLSVGLGGMFDTQSSFVGLLLREEALQGRVVDFLLEKLSEFATEMEGLASRAIEKNIPKLILREIRWIDHVVNSGELVEKLISTLPAFPVALQREIIYILPEIASDEDANVVINEILELIRSEAELVVCCIEALGNFNVASEQTEEVVKCVLERLDSSPLADLPVIVKYLVQEAPGANVELIAHELRDKLSASLSFAADTGFLTTIEGRRGSSSGPGADHTRNEEALVLGTIIQGFYFREDLVKAFITTISKCGQERASNMCLLDMWILMGTYSIPRDRCKVEGIFKKKVLSGLISRGLVVKSIKGHANALKSYFGSIIQLASLLISQESSPVSLKMGSLMYEVLFEEFSLCNRDGKNEATYYQGELVTSLLRFCLSAAGGTTNAAFETFAALVSPEVSFKSELRDRRYEQSHFKRRHRFQIFLPTLKQMLDVMETTSLDQVRLIYDILFSIGGHDDSELCNIVRKQTSHQETRYRLCGIIGSVTRMNHLVRQHREDAATRVDRDSAKRDANFAKDFYNWLTELFKMTTLSQGGCVSFFLRELQRWIKRLDLDDSSRMFIENVFTFSEDILSQRFMNDFDPAKDQLGAYRRPVFGGALKSDLLMCLDEARSTVYLKILDLTTSPNVRDQDSLHYLSSLVQLVLECARKTDKLKEVESVLVCPIQLMEKSVIEDIAGLDEKTQSSICSAVWHAINWIRSIIGFYADEHSNFHRAKVVERLGNLLELESMLLDDLLHWCPRFSPPGSQVASVDGQTPKTLALTKKKIGRPSKVPATIDRTALVRRSFDPLRADVLKVFTFQELERNVLECSVIDTVDEVTSESLIDFLMGTFESLALRARDSLKKNTDLSVLLTIFSEEFGWSQVQELDRIDQGSLVMQSVCRLTHHFFQKLVSDEVETARGALNGVANRIVMAYLNIGAILFEFPKPSSSSSVLMPSAKLCQDFFLAVNQHVILGPNPDEGRRAQVLETCFVVATKFASIIGEDISAAKTVLRVLLAIAGLTYGFPADLVASRATSIRLLGTVDRSAAREMSAKISEIALSFLRRDWSQGEKKFIYRSSDLDIFLDCYLNHGEVILDNIQTLALEGILALLEQGGSKLESLPTLNKKTIAVFHRAMFDALIHATARLDFANSLARERVELLLNYFTQAVLLFRFLVGITKSHPKSKIIATVLKLGRRFVEIVVGAMPFLKHHFMDHNDLVMKAIAEVQVATRRMQVLCAHGKLIKDATATAQVPRVKKLLEKFIYKGEDLAREHGVLGAFSTGILRNRRIDGTAIDKAELDAMEARESSSGSDDDDPETEVEEEESSTEDDENVGNGESGSSTPVQHRKKRKQGT